MRQAYLSQMLMADGHDVVTYASEFSGLEPSPDLSAEKNLEDIFAGRIVVLPLPVLDEDGFINAPLSCEKLSAAELFSALRSGSRLVAGKVPESLQALAESLGLRICDYFEREELAVLNAIPTAEGAIAIAMEELPITLHRAKCLVLGFGRIGKLLAIKLRALGAEVTAAARKYSDLAWISAYGCEPLLTAALAEKAGNFDVIFNTVPAPVLDEKTLAALKKGAVVIDLASKPGGVDFEAAARLGVCAIWALSLPGKVAPITSGEIIKNTIYNILNGWGDGNSGDKTR